MTAAPDAEKSGKNCRIKLKTGLRAVVNALSLFVSKFHHFVHEPAGCAALKSGSRLIGLAAPGERNTRSLDRLPAE